MVTTGRITRIDHGRVQPVTAGETAQIYTIFINQISKDEHMIIPREGGMVGAKANDPSWFMTF